MKAAKWSAVLSLRSMAFTLAPFSWRRDSISRWPLKAAWWRAVFPDLSVTSRLMTIGTRTSGRGRREGGRGKEERGEERVKREREEGGGDKR